MKIFDQVAPFGDKVNFVDENNVVVGYEMSQDCCEFASWFISEEKITEKELTYKWLKRKENQNRMAFNEVEYRFDIGFREDISKEATCDTPYIMTTIFRLVSIDGGPDLYLHLPNCKKLYGPILT